MKIRNSGALLAANLASSAALAALGSLVLRGATSRFDHGFRGYFPRYRGSRTKRTAETLGPLGKSWLHLTVTGGVAGYLLLRGKGLDSATTVILSAIENVGYRNVAVPIALSIPVSTALHALYLDRHWATDIIGGWLGAVAIGTACAYGYEIARAPKEEPRKTKLRLAVTWPFPRLPRLPAKRASRPPST